MAPTGPVQIPSAPLPVTNAHEADIMSSPYRRAGGEAPVCWRLRPDDKYGQPIPFHTCEWCGSVTPQQFIEFLAAGCKCDVADWKYGYPHKIYLNVPNPNPEELRGAGSTSEGSEMRYNERGVVTHRVKTQENAPAGYETWSDQHGWMQLGKYPMLHLKFYTAHLDDLPDLKAHEDVIFRATGIYFFRNAEGKLMYSGKKPIGLAGPT